jgi:Caspase domain
MILLAWLLMAAPSVDGLQRYAIIIGHNRGQAHEVLLSYASDDAQRMAEVLRTSGGVSAEHMVTMTNDQDNPDSIRQAIVAMNDRVRQEPHGAALIVYYSGHADGSALHIGSDELPLVELEQLVRGSAAQFRLLIVDACRSGSITRVKGSSDELVDGYVVLTASAAGEAAQESDELRGSFFTNALVSGLMGSADDDGDRVVTLAEAYRHTFDETVRATSGTESGVQHPTFRYDLRGRGDLALSFLAEDGASSIALPADMPVLLFQGDRIIAELSARSSRRTLVLSPGRYQVRARSEKTLYEGEVLLAPGTTHEVKLENLQQTSYARLTRKGGAQTWSVGAAMIARSPAWGYGIPLGVRMAVPVTLTWLTVEPRLQVLFSDSNSTLEQVQVESSLDVALRYVADFSWLSPSVALFAGMAWVHQQYFDDFRRTKPKNAVGPTFGVELGLQVPVAWGFAIDSMVELRSHALQFNLSAPLTLALGLGVTKSF